MDTSKLLWRPHTPTVHDSSHMKELTSGIRKMIGKNYEHYRCQRAWDCGMVSLGYIVECYVHAASDQVTHVPMKF
jgi:hypothetical protein